MCRPHVRVQYDARTYEIMRFIRRNAFSQYGRGHCVSARAVPLFRVHIIRAPRGRTWAAQISVSSDNGSSAPTSKRIYCVVYDVVSSSPAASGPDERRAAPEQDLQTRSNRSWFRSAPILSPVDSLSRLRSPLSRPNGKLLSATGAAANSRRGKTFGETDRPQRNNARRLRRRFMASHDGHDRGADRINARFHRKFSLP